MTSGNRPHVARSGPPGVKLGNHTRIGTGAPSLVPLSLAPNHTGVSGAGVHEIGHLPPLVARSAMNLSPATVARRGPSTRMFKMLRWYCHIRLSPVVEQT